jgi:dienelactone hydrolase
MKFHWFRSLAVFSLVHAFRCGLLAAEPTQIALDRYFEQQVSALEGQLEREIQTKEDWLSKKDEYRRQLREMLGIDPLPPRTDLKATKTGEFEQDGVVVENLHYQSMPGLYVTANLYRPKQVEKPLPTILYVCGHAVKEKNGVRYGNKAGYEHHGMWYAKHGFVCLVIDTVQLGEIRGEHHGTFSKDRMWWFSRGYTPAGVEAWAGIRALDYLETRPEVDKTRFGVTGRSGGGAYSWWIAALDERIACAAPTAGITTLRNHIVDGCVEGHCDCMFMVNTYRWDYDKLSALVAPRPLCIVNTDKDTIFPIDGVFKIYQSTRRIYKLLGAEKNIGLQVAEGPHADTQPLNTGEFHWMTRFLQGAELMSTLDAPAVKSIDMEKLRVFPVSSGLITADSKQPLTPEQQGWPSDQRNTRIDESFVAKSGAVTLTNLSEWTKQRDDWVNTLQNKTFLGWTRDPTPKAATKVSPLNADGVSMERIEIVTSDGNPLSLFVTRGTGTSMPDLELIALNVLDETGWKQFTSAYASKFPTLFPECSASKPDAEAFEQEKKMFATFKWGMAYVCPRGIGPTAWAKPIADPSDKKAVAAAEKDRVQKLRRFYLLGQTLEGQQVWDVRCAIRALRSIEGLSDTKLWLQASRTQAANALMASLFEDKITRLDLHELPHSLMPNSEGEASPVSAGLPAYLNMLKYLDIPQAVALAAERTRVVIYDNDKAAWAYPQQVSEKLGWGKDKKAGLQLRDVPKPQ